MKENWMKFRIDVFHHYSLKHVKFCDNDDNNAWVIVLK